MGSLRVLLGAGCACGLLLAVNVDARASDDVTVMTRNVYHGADFRPMFEATDLKSFFRAADQVHTQLRATNFPQRAKGLAAEIEDRKPDLIGLQEVALWHTAPVTLGTDVTTPPPGEVYQDYVQILLSEVNKGKVKYDLVDVEEAYDTEAPANTDNDASTGVMGADLAYRLTMREAILKRRGSRVQIKDVRAGRYSPANTLQLKIGPVTFNRVRGWLSTRARVDGGPWFTFANTHLEVFDDRTQVPSLRAKQAKEFADVMSAVKGPVIAVGDFNSDVPGLHPGDQQAYKTLKRNGFADVGTTKPLSCCIDTSTDLKHGGSVKEFDHRVDQIFTTTPKKVKKVKTWVTGRKKSFGYWHSDHAGVVGRYEVK